MVWLKVIPLSGVHCMYQIVTKVFLIYRKFKGISKTISLKLKETHVLLKYKKFMFTCSKTHDSKRILIEKLSLSNELGRKVF
jgi:hypothetical protein